ncbi:hypothetical protein [Leisingera methylohalidivorans]|uniref:hypothetical protein n=1 Tax=Leisingera methylohalidivorans TaxID=133924 RepID=UPI001FE1BE59|nr:hypothetical protein [Leisingera methylohalidivorans]
MIDLRHRRHSVRHNLTAAFRGSLGPADDALNLRRPSAEECTVLVSSSMAAAVSSSVAAWLSVC